jgi:hypothetical protein
MRRNRTGPATAPASGEGPGSSVVMACVGHEREQAAERAATGGGRGVLAQTAALVLFPVAGLAGAAVAAVAFGLANAVGEPIIVTALQRSFPLASLGRIMGLVMLASAGAFPVSVALTTAVCSFAAEPAA